MKTNNFRGDLIDVSALKTTDMKSRGYMASAVALFWTQSPFVYRIYRFALLFKSRMLNDVLNKAVLNEISPI